MIKKERRKKTVHYKQAKLGQDKLTLQEYIDLAIVKKNKPVKRVEFLDDNGHVRRVINSSKKQAGMTFGQMIRFEPGKDQTVIVLDDESSEYPVEKIPVPKNKSGKNQEVIESVLYFGVLGNHVTLIQSAALKSRDFERHIEWFTSQNTSVFPKDSAILLSDKPSASAIKKLNKQPIKKVSIGSSLETTPDIEPEEGKENLSAKKVKFHPSGDAWAILKAALGSAAIDDLKLEDSLDDGNLKVSLEVSYFRKTTKRANEVLGNIATAMRHHDPDDVRVELVGGGVLKGNDIKMSGIITVDTNNGIADSNDLYSEMKTWLESQIKLGTVS